jgi:hypothetical protein
MSENRLTVILARFCMVCPICKNARKHPHGICNWFKKKVENRICPFCRAYNKLVSKDVSKNGSI